MLTWSVCLKKMNSCQNNLEGSYTDKKTKHTHSGYSLFTNCYLMQQETKLIVTDGKTVEKSFVKT